MGANYKNWIWHKNSRNNVELNYKETLYKYKYYVENNKFCLEEDKKNWNGSDLNVKR